MKFVSFHSSKKNLLFFILVIAVFMGSFYVRWHNMSTIPYGIEGDEYAWVASAQIPVPRFEADAKYYPLSIWINQIAFRIFGQDILSARKMLVIVNVLSLFAFFFLLQFFFNKYIALLLVTVYSFSTYKLITSKIAMICVYQELPMLCAFILALLVRKYTSWKQYLCAFGVGICVVLTLLSYNITYMVPIITLGFLLFGLLKQPISWKRVMLHIFYYIVPLLFCLPFFFSVLKYEFEAKQYIFEQSNTPTTTSNILITPQSLAAHTQAVWKILWNPLTHGNSDMLLSYPFPMIPRLITIGAIIGLIFACVYWRKYWPFILWVLLQGVIYHIIFGFNLPRTWFLTVGVLYILTGITIQTLFNLFHRSIGKKLMIIILTGCLVYLVISGIIIYFTHAIQHSAYKEYIREIFDIAKKYQIQPHSSTYIVSDSDLAWRDTWLTAISFYNISNKQFTNSELNTYSYYDFHILSSDEYQYLNNYQLLPPCSTLIGESARAEIEFNKLSARCSKPYHRTQYTIFEIIEVAKEY